VNLAGPVNFLFSIRKALGGFTHQGFCLQSVSQRHPVRRWPEAVIGDRLIVLLLGLRISLLRHLRISLLRGLIVPLLLLRLIGGL
jgi:hypothetical protein